MPDRGKTGTGNPMGRIHRALPSSFPINAHYGPPATLMNNKITVVLILLFITPHSFLMNGFSHVNRYLTVGLYVDPIAAKLDPSLFRNSLYTQSVEGKKARLSLMHNLSPSIFRHVDLETFAILQWLICLFFTSAVLFYLGKTLIGTDLAGYVTALLFTGKLNEWTLGSPAVYINFFHHGLQWAIMLNILSLALIFRKKYLWVCFLMGVAWNFHPMSVLFILTLLFVHWLRHTPEYGIKTVLACCAVFICAALPMLAQSFDYLGMDWEYGAEWLKGVHWTVWYTVFPSTWPFFYFLRAGLYLWLFLLGLSTLPRDRKKSDLILFMITVGLLCAVGTIFAEIVPVPSVIKMSLWRSSWLYIILSLPCLAHLFITVWDRSFLRRFLIIATLILLTGSIHSFPYYYLLLFNSFFLLILARSRLEKRFPWFYRHLPFTFFILLGMFSHLPGPFRSRRQGGGDRVGCCERVSAAAQRARNNPSHFCRTSVLSCPLLSCSWCSWMPAAYGTAGDPIFTIMAIAKVKKTRGQMCKASLRSILPRMPCSLSRPT